MEVRLGWRRGRRWAAHGAARVGARNSDGGELGLGWAAVWAARWSPFRTLGLARTGASGELVLAANRHGDAIAAWRNCESASDASRSVCGRSPRPATGH
jgi:hypothetical protein